jgi:O-antigen/teichoic acid export membrane protein
VTVTDVRRSEAAPDRSTVAAAIIAQLSQAMGSFVLQLLVARMLGREGLAQFALLYGLVVVGTAVSTGLVGDALTVLDRHTSGVRAGLQWWAGRVVLLAATVLAAIASTVGEVTTVDALWFALATATFLAEDLVRRLLMASLRFWSIVVVDLVVLVGSVGVVAAVHVGPGTVSLQTFLLAMVVGQSAAGLVGWMMLPPADRRWVRHVTPERATVWRYGSWRALQHSIRPIALAVVRVVAIAVIGLAAYGEVEAARLFIAPAILAVNGASNYLFASFASSSSTSTSQLLRRADRGVAALLVAALLLGGAAVAALPLLGDAVAAGGFEISALAVAGWAAFAAATAAITPYGVLAAVRVPQAKVFTIRAVETVGSIGAVWVVLASGADGWTIPVVLGAGSAVAGWAIRAAIVAEDSP